MAEGIETNSATGKQHSAAVSGDAVLRQPGHRYEVLDGMRGVAAVIVMVYHWYLMTIPALTKNAYIAVDFFFILSGFVIMHAYGQRLRTGMSPIQYLLRRFIRLYPMAVLGIVLAAPVFVFYCSAGLCTYGRRDIVAALASNLFFLPYLNNFTMAWPDGSIAAGQLFPENDALWSIFYEGFASLAFIGLVVMPPRGLMRLVRFCFVVLAVSGVFFAFVGYSRSLQFGSGWNTATFLGGFPRVLYGFTCGMLIYETGRLPLLDRWCRFPVLSAVLAKRSATLRCLLAYAGLAACLLLPVNGLNATYLLIVGLAGPLLIRAASSIELKEGLLLGISKILGWLSYPIYCLHIPVMMVLKYVEAHVPMSPTAQALLLPAAFFAITFLLAWGLGKMIDEPLRRWLSQRLNGKRAPKQDNRSEEHTAPEPGPLAFQAERFSNPEMKPNAQA